VLSHGQAAPSFGDRIRRFHGFWVGREVLHRATRLSWEGIRGI
jgi:hypothetical protein